jgi:hypothetical protein
MDFHLTIREIFPLVNKGFCILLKIIVALYPRLCRFVVSPVSGTNKIQL